MLRHAPRQHGLEPDAEGFVPLAALLAAARAVRGLERTRIEDLLEAAAQGPPHRFEVRDDRMRAIYGHSVGGGPAVAYPPAVPPEVLYHGTRVAALARIRSEGLRAMSRQYVHLSTTLERARDVGSRRTSEPIVLEVRARRAHEAGVVFHQAESQHWLVRVVPPEFIVFPADGLGP